MHLASRLSPRLSMFPKTFPDVIQLSATDRHKISPPSTTTTNVRDFPAEVLEVRFEVLTVVLIKTHVF
jgi:hypothetical protein